MANVLIEESKLQAIADAIRSKTSKEQTMTVAEMATEIGKIGTYANPLLASTDAEMNTYLNDNQYLGMFVKFTGTISAEYSKDTIYCILTEGDAEQYFTGELITEDRVKTLINQNTYAKSAIDLLLTHYVEKVDGQGLSTNDFTDALKEKLENASSLIYKGSIAFSSLSETAVDVGWFYKVTDAFTTNASFVEGSGISYPANTLVVRVDSPISGIRWCTLANQFPKSWSDFLVNATFKIPQLTLSRDANAATAAMTVEYNSTVNVSLNHVETNIDNISNKIVLYRNNAGQSTTYDKSASLVKGFYTETIQVNSNYDYFIRCIDKLGNTRNSNTIMYRYYFPSFVGAVATASISDASALTKISGSIINTKQTVTVADGSKYIYFASTTVISGIKSSGFSVPLASVININLSINGATVAYKLYRTESLITPGTYEFEIS